MSPVLLSELFAGLMEGLPATPVKGMTSNSNAAVDGGLFLAFRGVQAHGLEYLPQALAAGVAFVAWEPEADLAEPELPDGVLGFAVPGLGNAAGLLADRFFAMPSAAMQVSGITGTNGKTTTAWLVAQAMQSLDVDAAYMGTLGYGRIDQVLEHSSLTTPGVIGVHRRLRELSDSGARYVALEASSHGLDQGRLDGVRFDTVAFINLSRDHLDYHGDMQSYAAAKRKLFTEFEYSTAIVNVANDYGRELAALLHKDVHLLTVSTSAADGAMLTAELVSSDAGGLCIRLSGEFGDAELSSPLWGDFNVENLVVALGILIAGGVSLTDAAGALSECRAPAGRMEALQGSADKPQVVIDFAHTPDALAKVLATVRDHCSGEVWCVFGCGGDRDQGKRSEMGHVAGEFADHTILTDDNPRDEDPAAIVADILQGFAVGQSPEVVHDRAAAIGRAVTAAAADDVVLIAGKGAENYQIVGARSLPFSDRDVALSCLGEVA